jgi:hypothetical protein
LNSRLIPLNGNAGAFLNVLATVPVRRVKLIEDDAAAATGFQYLSFEDNFVSTNVVAAAHEPITLPDATALAGLPGATVGFPAQGVSGAFNFRAADKILSVRGNAAGVTTLRVEEYE